MERSVPNPNYDRETNHSGVWCPARAHYLTPEEEEICKEFNSIHVRDRLVGCVGALCGMVCAEVHTTEAAREYLDAAKADEVREAVKKAACTCAPRRSTPCPVHG